MSRINIPFVPKNPNGELFVVVIGRISTVHQDIENIEASYRYSQEYLRQIYQGPVQIKLLGEQASGMLTDRATIREAEDLVAGGGVDLVIAEDLARIYRNPRHQYNFVQDCVDSGTRVICVGDNLDTADENWEITMGAAALRHGLHIPDTRRRVRRTATHSFHHGGMVQKVRYGYRKLTPQEAALGQFGPKDLRVVRLPECTPLIQEMMQRVMRGERYTAIADWLNTEGIEPGPYVVGRRWTPRVVVDLLEDPILSGTRTFRDTICRPIFKTGKHKSTKNAEPETKHYPELAHLGAEEHALLRQEIARRRAENVANRREQKKRSGIPRSRSYWPGQATTCGICGGLMYYAGAHFLCRNAGRRTGSGRCWNHVHVPVQLTRERIVAWLVDDGPDAADWYPALVDIVRRESEKTTGAAFRTQRNLAREITDLERQAANLAAAIAAGGELQALIEKLQGVEGALRKARAAEKLGDSAKEDEIFSAQPGRALLRERLLQLIASSYTFADILRKIFPEFVIHPAQTLDCGLVRPRATLKFSPRALAEAAGDRPPHDDDIPVELNLFDPPKHILWIKPCLTAKQRHPDWSLKKIAGELHINHMTVKRAMDYSRLMVEAGVEDPYRMVSARPQAASRWRQQPTPSAE
jgi:site-specific DNA recombinase